MHCLQRRRQKDPEAHGPASFVYLARSWLMRNTISKTKVNNVQGMTDDVDLGLHEHICALYTDIHTERYNKIIN